jgi:hypothetical protein
MKKIKTLRTVILFSFFSVYAILVVNGCNKMNVSENNTSNEKLTLARTAEKHFKNLAENEKPGPARPSSAVKLKSTKIRVTPLSKMGPFIQWESATEVKRDKLTYTIVPVKDDSKRFRDKDHEFFRSIIFYREEGGKKNMIILEVLSMKGKSLGDDFHKIASMAFENKYFSGSKDIDGLNAYVLFFNENYTEDKSFQLTDGKWVPERVSFRSDLEIIQ